MKKPIFSICIPHFGTDTLLLKAVRSVASQTIKSFNLQISLNSQISEACYKEILKLIPSTIIATNLTKGISQNWNFCIQQANEKYIVLLHSDDELKPNYLEEMHKLILEKPATAWFCDVDLIDIKGELTKTLPDSIKQIIKPKFSTIEIKGDEGLALLLKGCFIYCPTICYDRVILDEYLFSNNWEMVLDLELYSRLLFDGHTIIGCDKKLFNYRRHHSNQTKLLTENSKRFLEERKLYNRISKQSKKKSFKHSEKHARLKIMLRLHILFELSKRLYKCQFKNIMHLIGLLKN